MITILGGIQSQVEKQGNVPLNALLIDVQESKNSIFAASAFLKSSLFLPQL